MTDTTLGSASAPKTDWAAKLRDLSGPGQLVEALLDVAFVMDGVGATGMSPLSLEITVRVGAYGKVDGDTNAARRASLDLLAGAFALPVTKEVGQSGTVYHRTPMVLMAGIEFVTYMNGDEHEVRRTNTSAGRFQIMCTCGEWASDWHDDERAAGAEHDGHAGRTAPPAPAEDVVSPAAEAHRVKAITSAPPTVTHDAAGAEQIGTLWQVTCDCFKWKSGWHPVEADAYTQHRAHSGRQTIADAAADVPAELDASGESVERSVETCGLEVDGTSGETCFLWPLHPGDCAWPSAYLTDAEAALGVTVSGSTLRDRYTLIADVDARNEMAGA